MKTRPNNTPLPLSFVLEMAEGALGNAIDKGMSGCVPIHQEVKKAITRAKRLERQERRHLVDVQTIVEYNWEDEREDFKEQERNGETRHHVFHVLRRLDRWEKTRSKQIGK